MADWVKWINVAGSNAAIRYVGQIQADLGWRTFAVTTTGDRAPGHLRIKCPIPKQPVEGWRQALSYLAIDQRWPTGGLIYCSAPP